MPIVRCLTLFTIFDLTHAIRPVTMQYIWTNGVRSLAHLVESHLIFSKHRLTRATTTTFVFLPTTTLLRMSLPKT